MLDQLKVGGIMVVPVGDSSYQALRRYKKESEDTFAVKDLCTVKFVPLLPNLAPASEGADNGPRSAAG